MVAEAVAAMADHHDAADGMMCHDSSLLLDATLWDVDLVHVLCSAERRERI